MRAAFEARVKASDPKSWIPVVSGERLSSVRLRPDLDSANLTRFRKTIYRELLYRVSAFFQILNEVAWILWNLNPVERTDFEKGYPFNKPVNEVLDDVTAWYKALDEGLLALSEAR